MKKIISILLVACMAISGCMIFSSCSRASVNDFEKNPNEAMADAMSNTFSKFFEDNLGISDALDKISDKFSVDVAFKLDDEKILEKPISLNATLYSDMKERNNVIDASVKFDDEKYSARLYTEPSKFAFESESILGNKDVLMIDTKSFVDKFEDSAIVKMAGLEQEEIDAVVSALEAFNKYADMDGKEMSEDTSAKLDEIYYSLRQTVEKDKVENVDGKEEKCIVMTYTIDEDTIADVMEYLQDEFFGDVDIPQEVKDELQDALDELNELNIDIKAKLYVSQKTNTLIKATLDGDLEGTEIEGELTVSESAIEVSVEVVDEGKFVVEIEKEKNGDEIKYAVSAKLKTESFDASIVKADITMNKSGEFEISASIFDFIDGDMNDRIKVKLSGNASADKNSATFEFDKLSITAGDIKETYKFDFSLKITADAEVPEIPSDAKDVVDLSQEEWEKLVEDIQNSDLVSIFGVSKGDPAPDEEYYW